MNAGGAGGNGLVAASALVRVLTALPAASAGAAMLWLIPIAPITLLLIEAGTDIFLVARRTVCPFSR